MTQSKSNREVLDLTGGVVVPTSPQHLPVQNTCGDDDWGLTSYFQQDCLRRAVLSVNCHNMSLAHTPEFVDELLAIYREVSQNISEIKHRREPMRSHLDGEPLRPVFTRPM